MDSSPIIRTRPNGRPSSGRSVRTVPLRSTEMTQNIPPLGRFLSFFSWKIQRGLSGLLILLALLSSYIAVYWRRWCEQAIELLLGMCPLVGRCFRMDSRRIPTNSISLLQLGNLESEHVAAGTRLILSGVQKNARNLNLSNRFHLCRSRRMHAICILCIFASNMKNIRNL